MKTTLTTKNLEILYNMACQMPPFNNLPMPKSRKVKFKVIKNPNIYGCFDEHEMEIQKCIWCIKKLIRFWGDGV
jgi:hypothetical protein